VATFICFDQTENIVTRTSGEEIKLSIKFNVLLALGWICSNDRLSSPGAMGSKTKLISGTASGE